MTDRELLEMAAKAAGMNVPEWESQQGHFYWVPAHGFWNPLTDDGDALRLAVKLGMRLDRAPNRCWAHAAGMAINGVCEEFYKDDPYAATRRVIVRTAAEIGRAQA